MAQHRNGTKTRQNDAGEALMPYSGSPGVMAQIRDEFDRMFDRFTRFWPGMGLMRGEQFGQWGLDMRDENDAVVVRAELPGFDADDIDVNVSENRLVVRANHKAEGGGKEGEGRTWQQREFYQAVTLPASIDPEKIDARYRNGVLTVHLPKTAQAKGRRVPIRKE